MAFSATVRRRAAVVASPRTLRSDRPSVPPSPEPRFRPALLGDRRVGGRAHYLAALALSVHVYDETGSGRWLAALLIADFLPIVLIGLTLGPLVDRFRASDS